MANELTQNQSASKSPFTQELKAYEPQLTAALPSHISVEKFERTIITAINANPDLARSDRRSLFTACVKAAHDGLFPDGREAALVVFNNKNKKTGAWEKSVTYMPMVAGIIKRLRNSGDLAAISSHVVYERDEFIYELGMDPKLVHRPAFGNRGKPIAVYAIAKLTNGEVLPEVMDVDEVEKVRAVSKAKDSGPWVDWWDQMARKTCIRRLSKMLPNSSEIEDTFRREEEQYAGAGENPTPPSTPKKPTRQMFEPDIQITDVEDEDEQKTNGQADNTQGTEVYEIFDHVGEETTVHGAEPAAALYRTLLESAAKVNGQAVRTLYENNVLLFRELDERGHGGVSRQLGLDTAQAREAAEAKARPTEETQGAAPAEKAAAATSTAGSPGRSSTTRQRATKAPPTRDPFWNEASYAIPTVIKGNGIMDFVRVRDDIMALAETAETLDELGKLKADNEVLLGKLRDAQKDWFAAVATHFAACEQRLS